MHDNVNNVRKLLNKIPFSRGESLMQQLQELFDGLKTSKVYLLCEGNEIRGAVKSIKLAEHIDNMFSHLSLKIIEIEVLE